MTHEWFHRSKVYLILSIWLRLIIKLEPDIPFFFSLKKYGLYGSSLTKLEFSPSSKFSQIHNVDRVNITLIHLIKSVVDQFWPKSKIHLLFSHNLGWNRTFHICTKPSLNSLRYNASQMTVALRIQDSITCLIKLNTFSLNRVIHCTIRVRHRFEHSSPLMC